MNSTQIVVFNLDAQRYALYLSAVERVIPALEITPLPKAPDIVIGVINIEGRIIPVVDVRKRFNLPQRTLGLSDQIILGRTTARTVALIVDGVTGVSEFSNVNLVPNRNISPGLDHIDGVVKLEDGMVLIHDLEEFLALGEERELESALAD